MAKTPQIKLRARVVLRDSKGNNIGTSPWHNRADDVVEGTDLHSYGTFLRVPVGKDVGKVETFTITVEYLGQKQYKQTYQQRAKAMAANEKRREKWQKEADRQKLERDEKELAQRRKRIVNQIELAFVKELRGAVDFITCDKCNATATYLGLAYENPGSQVLDTDQITGAWCPEHHGRTYNGTFYVGYRPFKTKAVIGCSVLEFFYDGLRQIYVKPGTAA